MAENVNIKEYQKMNKIKMKIFYITIAGILLFFVPTLSAQTKWSLDSCIHYAIEHNYTIKQNLLMLETKRIELTSSKMNIAPSVSASVGQNLDFGRAPLANGVIENQSQATTSLGIYLNMPLFEGLRNHYQIQAGKLDLQAAINDLQQAKENIELNVSAYYLQVLLCKEVLEIANEQAMLSEAQITRIETLVKNGKSPNSELYTAKATFAADQYNITDASNNLRLAFLDLKQLLNLSESNDFDITDIQEEDFERLLHRNIDLSTIVNNGILHRPNIKAVQNRIEMSKKNIGMARSGWYPSLGFSASYGTGYYYAFQNEYMEHNLPFNTQFSNNSRGMLAFSLNVPLFDKLSTYHNVQRSKINLKSYEIQLEETKANLTKEIEQAYTNAIASKEKYLSAETYLEAAQIAFEYEEIRYNAGASAIFEYDDAKTKYRRAQSDLVQSKYSFLIRLKIIDFYGK